ncbi:MAG: HAD family hydrolase [Alphaproteobacteria bacterium]
MPETTVTAKPPTHKPRAIIFDTDNTLYPYDPAHKAAMQAIEAKAEQLLNISVPEFRKVLSEARAQTKARLQSTASSHSRLLYLQRAIELLGLGTQIFLTLDLEQTYWRTFLASSTLFPEAKEFLVDIKSDGVTTAIITDLTAQIQFRKIVYFGLDSYFDYVVTSEEAGYDKPHDAPFQMAMEKLGLPGEDIWMVGDNPTADIGGARKNNLVTLQKVHASVETHDSGPGVPDFSFMDYSELRQLWKRL